MKGEATAQTMEQITGRKRAGPRYTDDELTAALLALALKRDLTPICQAYGLKVSPERVAHATASARPLCATGN